MEQMIIYQHESILYLLWNLFKIYQNMGKNSVNKVKEIDIFK